MTLKPKSTSFSNDFIHQAQNKVSNRQTPRAGTSMELFQLHTGSAESSEEKSQSQEQILSLSDDNVKVRQRFSSQMIREKSQ